MVWLRGTEQRDGQGSRTQVLPSASLRGELRVLSTWLGNGLPILCPGPARSPGPCKLSGLWRFPTRGGCSGLGGAWGWGPRRQHGTKPRGTAPGVVAVLGAWPGAAGAWLCVQINRSHRSSGASKLLQIKQLNDTSLVLLLFFFNLTNVPKHKRGGC